ncbi:MAG TPA: YkvA family protein [Gemmatimonadaceae bacterium]|nr:YkvA family protein [Gemmatimonadaceae bacterium]
MSLRTKRSEGREGGRTRIFGGSSREREEREERGRSPRAPRRGAKRTILGAIRQIPAYLRLLWGLLTDERVSTVDKVLVGAAIGYVIMPFDLIPDFIPVIGEVDDIYVIMLALDRLISHAGADVLADHWDGDPRDLTPKSLEAVLLAAAFFLPFSARSRVRRRLRKRLL